MVRFMESTWARRDLPVLDLIVRALEEVHYGGDPEYPDTENLSEGTGLDETTVAAALQALDGEYITLRQTSRPGVEYVTAVTPAARRAVGQWPSPENLVDQLAARIGDAAEQEPDPERKSRLQSVARGLTGIARSVAVNVLSAYADGTLPHAR